jgi:hypothetical protein
MKTTPEQRAKMRTWYGVHSWIIDVLDDYDELAGHAAKLEAELASERGGRHIDRMCAAVDKAMVKKQEERIRELTESRDGLRAEVARLEEDKIFLAANKDFYAREAGYYAEEADNQKRAVKLAEAHVEALTAYMDKYVPGWSEGFNSQPQQAPAPGTATVTLTLSTGTKIDLTPAEFEEVLKVKRVEEVVPTRPLTTADRLPEKGDELKIDAIGEVLGVGIGRVWVGSSGQWIYPVDEVEYEHRADGGPVTVTEGEV